jgi:antitoxin component YwqK of YwqJK toxin-antitoxin module
VNNDQGKYDSDGRLRNGPYEERFKDGSLACTGEYLDGEKTGEWTYYLRNGLVGHLARS